MDFHPQRAHKDCEQTAANQSESGVSSRRVLIRRRHLGCKPKLLEFNYREECTSLKVRFSETSIPELPNTPVPENAPCSPQVVGLAARTENATRCLHDGVRIGTPLFEIEHLRADLEWLTTV
jgi:hypothetical protein